MACPTRGEETDFLCRLTFGMLITVQDSDVFVGIIDVQSVRRGGHSSQAGRQQLMPGMTSAGHKPLTALVHCGQPATRTEGKIAKVTREKRNRVSGRLPLLTRVSRVGSA